MSEVIDNRNPLGESRPHDEQFSSEATNANQAARPVGSPLPRPERRRRRAKADRGLPNDEELARLATEYLERQRKHWPQAFEAGMLTDPTPELIQSMVEEFKQRHRGASVAIETVTVFVPICAKLAGSYNRFSCDNSSPTSVLDQMVNGLAKAKCEGRFIPWQYVYADYAVTGLDASRQGYSSYKTIMAHKDHLIETTYIDDFTRASRDEIEWWRLAALSKRLNKRMIGSSDGFDVSSPDWDIKITLYSLVSRLFMKSLRERVRRGRRGASERGNAMGKLSLGFTRRERLDAAGNSIINHKGRPTYEPCIDPVTSQERLLMLENFVKKNWSPNRIAQDFNDRKVDGWDGWTESAIRGLLKRPDAIGVFIWNKTHLEYDWEQGKSIVVKNPRSEWHVVFDRARAIVPMDLWRAARRKLAASSQANPKTGRKPSRNQKSATTLFSGTLFCDDCDAELKLSRSAGPQKQMSCLNGRCHVKGCRLTASKSVRIVEDCLLTYLHDSLLSEPVVEQLVEKANEFLEQEAQKPQADIAPMKANAQRLKKQIQRLVDKIAETDDRKLSSAYHERVLQFQKQLNEVTTQIRAAETSQRRQHQRLDLVQAKLYLANLRELLQGDIPIAAEVIRDLTGPIKIRQEPIPGRKHGSRWIASFRPKVTALLRKVSAAEVLDEATMNGIASEPQLVQLPLEKVPAYERLASEFQRLSNNGASVLAISRAYSVSWTVVEEGLDFAATGERPKGRRGKRTGNGRKPTKFQAIAEQVVKLRREKKWGFDRIGDELSVSATTAQRAYDHACPEAVVQAVASGQHIDRGRHTFLDFSIFEKVRELHRQGLGPKAIAPLAGCSESTARREIARIANEEQPAQAEQPQAKSA